MMELTGDLFLLQNLLTILYQVTKRAEQNLHLGDFVDLFDQTLRVDHIDLFFQ